MATPRVTGLYFKKRPGGLVYYGQSAATHACGDSEYTPIPTLAVLSIHDLWPLDRISTSPPYWRGKDWPVNKYGLIVLVGHSSHTLPIS